jgi:hypothetical protein
MDLEAQCSRADEKSQLGPFAPGDNVLFLLDLEAHR